MHTIYILFNLVWICIYYKICFFPGSDTLEYLSVEGLVSAVHYNMKATPSDGVGGHCTACLTGEYPGGLPEDVDW